MLGMIRVKTVSDPQELGAHAEILKRTFQIDAITRCIPDQPHGVHDDESEQSAIEKVIALAKDLVRERDIRALTISCTADPGIDLVRKAVPVPVFGAGETSIHAALMTSSRIGVLGILDSPSPELAAALSGTMQAYEYSDNHRRASSLQGPDALEDLVAAASRLKERGSRSILLDCTGFSGLGLADALRARLGLPVVDPVETQGVAYRLLTGF